MQLHLGHTSFETFCSTYWRRQPLYVPGGARQFLEAPVEPAQFLAACERLERLAPGQLFRKGPDLAFAQRVDLADGMLHRVCERFAGWVAGAQIWFDGVYAREGMGIGSHFDLADTFLLQQRGTKLWRLHPPSFLPEETIRRRLLNETELDAMYMPDGALEFRLHEGDLLYLPLLWVHWGVSEGESLSLSLGFTARSGLDGFDWAGLAADGTAADWGAAPEARARAVERARASLWRTCYPRPNPTQVPALRLPAKVRAALAHDPRWWRPLPTVWTLDGEPAVEAATRAQAARHVDALAASLPELAGAWAEGAAEPPPAASVARSARYEGPAARGDEGALPGLDGLARDAAALPDPAVDPARLASPEHAFDEAA
ncbi:MAG TPA: cupin domain-containing protein, partial [Polyangiaceae bacterium]|nr:cupin domain-containing protein [Polyangiaceae bacterium]